MDLGKINLGFILNTIQQVGAVKHSLNELGILGNSSIQNANGHPFKPTHEQSRINSNNRFYPNQRPNHIANFQTSYSHSPLYTRRHNTNQYQYIEEQKSRIHKRPSQPKRGRFF